MSQRAAGPGRVQDRAAREIDSGLAASSGGAGVAPAQRRPPLDAGAVGRPGQAAGGAVDRERDGEGGRRGAARLRQGRRRAEQVAALTVHQKVGQARRMGVQDLPCADAGEVVGAARQEARAGGGRR